VLSTLALTNDLDGTGAGSLGAPVAAARNGDTVVFDSSLNGQTITLARGEPQITKNLTIQGPGAAEVMISGGVTSARACSRSTAPRRRSP
jgi:hypothetical protein